MEPEKLSRLFKALSNAQRLKLFKMIYDWQVCEIQPDQTISCCDAVERAFSRACCNLSLSKSTVSHHLKELQIAGLIEVKRKGQSASVRICEDAVMAIRNFL